MAQDTGSEQVSPQHVAPFPRGIVVEGFPQWWTELRSDPGINPSDKVVGNVLFELATHPFAPDNNETSVTDLEWLTGLSRATIFRALERLEGKRWLRISHGGETGTPNRYVLTHPEGGLKLRRGGSQSETLPNGSAPPNNQKPRTPGDSEKVGGASSSDLPTSGSTTGASSLSAGVPYVPSERSARIVRFFQEKHQARPDALNVPPKGPLQYKQEERLLKKYPVEEIESIIDWTFQHGWWADKLKSVDHMVKHWEKVSGDYRRSRSDDPGSRLPVWNGASS